MKYISLNKKTIIIGSAVLVAVVLVIVVVSIVSNNRKVALVKMPKDTDWGRELTDVESEKVVRIADALYNDMSGWNIMGHNKYIYQEYNSVSDKVFVGVANYFAEKYGKGDNLAKWIKDEAFAWSSLTDSIINRLATFGITA